MSDRWPKILQLRNKIADKRSRRGQLVVVQDSELVLTSDNFFACETRTSNLSEDACLFGTSLENSQHSMAPAITLLKDIMEVSLSPKPSPKFSNL